MSNLTRLALEALECPDSPPGLRTVACMSLLHALEGNVHVPPGTHMAVWRFLLASEAGASVLHRFELTNPDVANDAVRVLLDQDAGEQACDIAVAVLRGGNAAAVTPEALLTLCDRVLDEGRVRRAVWLCEQAHEHRGLAPEFVRALRDRLAGSEIAAVRAGAVEIGALIPDLDVSFYERMLADRSPVVRVAAAEQLEKVDEVHRDPAASIIRAHLNAEDHRSVLRALHEALATLVGRRARKVRLWEPPEGSSN